MAVTVNSVSQKVVSAIAFNIGISAQL